MQGLYIFVRDFKGGGGLVNEGAYKIENSMCAAAMLEE